MLEQTQVELGRFAKSVVRESRRNLTRKGKRDTNDLWHSLKYELDTHKNSFSLSFWMADHGAYVDQGVKGKSSSSRAPRSPFRFGTGSGKKGGLTKSIEKWTKRKGIQFKDRKTGRFLTRKSTAFLISRAIYHKGIKPSLFFTKPFEKAFDKMPQELIEKFGLDIDELLESTLNG